MWEGAVISSTIALTQEIGCQYTTEHSGKCQVVKIAHNTMSLPKTMQDLDHQLTKLEKLYARHSRGPSASASRNTRLESLLLRKADARTERLHDRVRSLSDQSVDMLQRGHTSDDVFRDVQQRLGDAERRLLELKLRAARQEEERHETHHAALDRSWLLLNNPYRVLGVPETASKRQIQQAYRKLALQRHPDKGGDIDAFRQLQLAHEILSDVDERQQYDDLLAKQRREREVAEQVMKQEEQQQGRTGRRHHYVGQRMPPRRDVAERTVFEMYGIDPTWAAGQMDKEKRRRDGEASEASHTLSEAEQRNKWKEFGAYLGSSAGDAAFEFKAGPSSVWSRAYQSGMPSYHSVHELDEMFMPYR